MRLPAAAGGTVARIGARAWDELAPVLGGRGAVLVADRRVLALHGREARRAIGRELRAIIALPRGERAKRPDVLVRGWNELARLALPRSGFIVALGGGAALDVAGLLASTWMRGIEWVALPTTLLAQADACFGGKTAIDLEAGKNLVGTFHPPRLALADPTVLSTLPGAEYRAARFELLKCGWLGDRRLVALALSPALAAREPQAVAEAVARALATKARLVSADPFDHAERRLLNLGHTFGHALEVASRFELRHGEAVGIGLLAAVRAAEALGVLPARAAARRAAEVLALEPARSLRAVLPGALRAVRRDKKAGPQGLTLVLPTERGAAVREGVALAVFRDALGGALDELRGPGRSE